MMSEPTNLPDKYTSQDSGLSSLGSDSENFPMANSSGMVITDCGSGPSEVPKITPKNGSFYHKRTFNVTYLGEHVLDRRYTQHMLPWIMAEVRRRQVKTNIYLEVQSQWLRAMAVVAATSTTTTTTTTAVSQTTTVAPEAAPSMASTATPLFEHKLQSLSRFARTHQDQKCFAYLTRAHMDSPFTCHVFQAQDEGLVPELFTAIREATRSAVRDSRLNMNSNEGRSVDSVGEFESANLCGRLFEVMYIGKVNVKDKKGPPTIIDEAVEIFQSGEHQKLMESSKKCHHDIPNSKPGNIERPLNQGCAEKGWNNQNEEGTGCFNDQGAGEGGGGIGGSCSCEQMDNGNMCVDLGVESMILVDDGKQHSELLDGNQNKRRSVGGGGELMMGEGVMSSSGVMGSCSYNRILLIQVGQYELCLISPDKKTVILERKFRDISFCFQGINHPEHFGFNTRDSKSGSFVCYVFRCSSKPVVEEIMQALQQAFHSAFQQSVKNHVVCELCPMHQLHKLCQEIEGLSPGRAGEVLHQRVEQLSEKDYNEIMTAYKLEGAVIEQDKCEVMMILLRQMCERKQREHIHISDGNKSQTKSEFCLMDKSKPSKFDSFKSKAKKSLAHSFENFITRGIARREEAKASFRQRSSSTTESDATESMQSFDSAYTPENTPDPSPCTSPITKTRPSPDTLELRRDFTRQRSATIGALPDDRAQLQLSPIHNQLPKPTIEVTHPRLSPLAQSPVGLGGGLGRCFGQDGLMLPSYGNDRSMLSPGHRSNATSASSTPSSTPGKKHSWRLGILNRVVTPARVTDDKPPEPQESESQSKSGDKRTERKWRAPLTKAAIRGLWRKAILETLLLIRMEKENISLQARQDAAEIKKVKLDYQEIIPCLKEVTKVWEEMLATPGRPKVQLDQHELHNAVKSGVPRHRRGDIWRLLVEQDQLQRVAVSSGTETRSNYEDLLKQLTTHQHAILIDLGRTFPGHPYFARQLGAGQLSLFNLLKAYSLLDQEVGYCQGLSFVAGVLLMHMQEEVAFDTLRHLMSRLGFRRQYRPDMVALQIQMYQLSRLLHDMYRDLYDHLEHHDIAPTLYAAPWFLTLFASQFPLGFVARVYDLIFLQGVEVVFKVALVLLGDHRELIKQCNNFETIVEFLKTTLPSMSIIQMERVINQVFQLDITKQLQAYEVEYHVLQEEMISSPQGGDADLISKLEVANQGLKRQNLELIEQLQSSHNSQHSLEMQITNLLASENKLRSHIRTLELERMALLQTVTKLQQLVPPELLATISLTQAPNNMSQPPNSLSQNPNNLPQPPNSLSQAPNNLPQPPNSLSQAPNNLSQPPNNLSQNPNNLSQPQTNLSHPPKSLSQPPSRPTQPPSKPPHPPTYPSQPPTHQTHLPSNQGLPPSNPTQPPTKLRQPSPNRPKPPSNRTPPSPNRTPPPHNRTPPPPNRTPSPNRSHPSSKCPPSSQNQISKELYA